MPPNSNNETISAHDEGEDLPRMGVEPSIDTGDEIHHGPSGESWLVAFVEGGKLCAAGWPCSLVPLGECTLTKKATPEQRQNLLLEMSAMRSDDPRKSYASRRLSKPTKPTGCDMESCLKLAQKAIYDSDGRGLSLQGRRFLADRVARAIYRAALSAAPQSDGWRPMETAPEMGEFLVYMPQERTQIQVAKWHPNVKTIGGSFSFDLTAPTHWHPLPKIPQTEGQSHGE